MENDKQVQPRRKTSDIVNTIYDLLATAKPYSLWNASKILEETDIKSPQSINNALLKLRIQGKLDEIVITTKLGRNTIMVKK